MKVLNSIALMIGLISILGLNSCKKYETESLMVVKDCTATYLRDGDVDLPVTNTTMLSEIDSGEYVTVKYYYPKTKNTQFAYGGCSDDHGYPRGEWITIEEIK